MTPDDEDLYAAEEEAKPGSSTLTSLCNRPTAVTHGAPNSFPRAMAPDDKDLHAAVVEGDDQDLYAAVMAGDLRITLERLQIGADVEEPGFSGVTPLHEAVKRDRIDIVAALLLFSADPSQMARSGLPMADLARSEITRTLLGFFSGEVEIDANNTKLVVGALDKLVRWRMVKQMGALKEKHKKRQAKLKTKPTDSNRLEKLSLLEQRRSPHYAAESKNAMLKQPLSKDADPPSQDAPEKLHPAFVSQQDSAYVSVSPQKISYPIIVAPTQGEPDMRGIQEAESVKPQGSAESQSHTGSLREQLERKGLRLDRLRAWEGSASISRVPVFPERQHAAVKVQKPATEHFAVAASATSLPDAPVERNSSNWRPPSPQRSFPFYPFGPPPRTEQQASVEGRSLASSSRATPTTDRPPRPRGAQEEALATAVQEGKLVEVIQLLLKGADPGAPDFAGETPLFEAAASSDASITAALLLMGADAEHQSVSGVTASSFSDSPTISVLLDLFASTGAGAARNCNIRAVDKEAALQQLFPGIRWAASLYLQGKGWAARQSLDDFAVCGGAGESSTTEEARVAPQEEGEASELLALQDVDPLIRAVRQGALADVERMLTKGAMPDVVDEVGETPLFEAIAGANTDIVVALLLARADPEFRSNSGQKPADLAFDEEVRFLLDIFTAEIVTPEMWEFSKKIKERDSRMRYLEMLEAREIEGKQSVFTRALAGQH